MGVVRVGASRERTLAGAEEAVEECCFPTVAVAAVGEELLVPVELVMITE